MYDLGKTEAKNTLWERAKRAMGVTQGNVIIAGKRKRRRFAPARSHR